MLNNLLDSQILINQKYDVNRFIQAADNTAYLNRHLNCDVESITSMYVIRPRNLELEDSSISDELHIIMISLKRVDISFKDRKTLFNSIQRKILYPVILILNYEDVFFEIISAQSHLGKKKEIMVSDNIIQSGWIEQEELVRIFSKINSIICSTHRDFCAFLDNVHNCILPDIGFYEILEDDEDPDLEFEYQLFDQWNKYLQKIGYHDLLSVEFMNSEDIPDCFEVIQQMNYILDTEGSETIIKFLEYIDFDSDNLDSQYKKWLMDEFNENLDYDITSFKPYYCSKSFDDTFDDF